ncbi:MAG: TetR/AcrR family transcriptional regulator [Clostridiales bacterium]|nr:TetR/AcrR family transcriptional regulator [Clostridiales bacterium]
MTLRKKIIDAAYTLFCEKGYQKTSVNSIIEKACTSKGGFYHHFKTKEEVVEVIAYDFVVALDQRYKDKQVEKTKTVYEQINGIIQEANTYRESMITSWPGIAKMFSFPGSTIIIQSTSIQFEKITAKAYHSLFLQGIAENLFATPYPKQTARLFAREMIHIYSSMTQVMLSDDLKTYDEFVASLEFTENILNNALGLAEHKILVKDEALRYLSYVKDNYKMR